MLKRCPDCGFTIDLSAIAYTHLGTDCPKCSKCLENYTKPSQDETRIEDRVRYSLIKWFGEMGIEATLEMLERQENLPHMEYFCMEIFSRGLVLKQNKGKV